MLTDDSSRLPDTKYESFMTLPRTTGVHTPVDRVPAVVSTFPLGQPVAFVSSQAVSCMRRCLDDECRTYAIFNFKGNHTGKYCKRHAKDGMVNVITKLCSHNVCSKIPNFNVEGSKVGKYCKRHAEDGMVSVLAQRCSDYACFKRPHFNVEGSKIAKYCKQHADDGMVDIRNKQCSHDSCIKRPSFNFASSRTSIYCKEHAENGMVNIRSKRCSHDSCVKQPSFNLAGKKTSVYCKEHAKDGMVIVHGKRCSHDSCKKGPSFNFASRKMRIYCKEHAKDGMVSVGSTVCSHDYCMRYAYYNNDTNTTPEYCKKHSEEGMVRVRPPRSRNGRRTHEPARSVQTNETATADTARSSDFLNGGAITPDSPCEVADSRKRPRLVIDGNQPPHYFKDRPLGEGGVVQVEGVGLSKSVLDTSSSPALPRHHNDSTVSTATGQFGQIMLHNPTAVPDELLSGQRIKTEAEVDVLL